MQAGYEYLKGPVYFGRWLRHDFSKGILVKLSRNELERRRDFIIMVDGPESPAELMDQILAKFPDAKLDDRDCVLQGRDINIDRDRCILQGNDIQIWQNESADPEKVQDPDHASVCFAFRVTVWPLVHRSKNSQVGLGRQLRKLLRQAGWKAEICSQWKGLRD